MRVFLDKCSFLQKSCFDPFWIHKKTVKCSLREIDIKSVLKVNQCMGLNMKPGQKLCSRCVTLLKNEEYSDNLHDSDEEDQPPTTTADEQLNTSVTALGLSSMKTHKVGKKRQAQLCWSIDYTAKEFNVSTYMVKQARKVKTTQGMLSQLQ
ncbi:ARL14 effector protein-like [Schistocerca nitens]|uniref:ARL14 effector protein-like n=1 Tax=Schistocerca nitens TaxID=7011 RepID=UPI00211882F1|nr:ARL14 effector protein-like [Schistocerca nitens]